MEINKIINLNRTYMFNFIFLNLFFIVSFNTIAFANTPFEVSRQIGNNISQAFRMAKQENDIQNRMTQQQNNIQNIMNEVSYAQTPEDIKICIYRVICEVSPERQPLILDYLYRELERKERN